MVITHTKEEAVRIAEIANAHRVSELPEDLIAAVFLDGTPGQVLKDFSKPDGQKHRGTPRILIVCARLLEGYDNKNISVCVILRNISRQSAVLFAQFIGRCLRRHQDDLDIVEAKMITHIVHKQQSNFEAFCDEEAMGLPEDEPEEFHGY